MAKRDRSYRFEMPYQVEAPILTDPDAGIDRVLLRGNPAGRVLTLTVFDTTDERLGRAGVLLAHQVVGESGQWLLRAGDWQPWLPADRLTELDDGDELPQEVAELLRPFRRRAPLGPVAAITFERSIFALLDPAGDEIGRLLDDRVTVRRGGLAVARHREVTFAPDEQASALQRSLVVDRLNQAGALRVAEFADPATRLASLIHPVELLPAPRTPEEISTEDYLEWLFTDRLHSLMRAELALRSGQVPDTGALAGEVGALAEQVRGLGAVVDEVWANELVWHAEKVTAQPARTRISDLGESYYEVLDALASAARAPRLRADATPAVARVELRAAIGEALARALPALDQLAADSADAEWGRATDALAQALGVLDAAVPVLGKLGGRRKRMAKLLAGLAAGQHDRPEPEPAELAAMDPVEAFRAGREYQARLSAVAGPRDKWLAEWPRSREKLLADWPEEDADD